MIRSHINISQKVADVYKDWLNLDDGAFFKGQMTGEIFLLKQLIGQGGFFFAEK